MFLASWIHVPHDKYSKMLPCSARTQIATYMIAHMNVWVYASKLRHICKYMHLHAAKLWLKDKTDTFLQMYVIVAFMPIPHW